MKNLFIRFNDNNEVIYASLENLHTDLNYVVETDIDLMNVEDLTAYCVFSVSEVNKTCEVKLK